MFTPRSLKQAASAAERLDIFCRDYVVPISSQTAKDLISKMYGFRSWGELKKAIDVGPFSVFDEKVDDQVRKQRQDHQVSCLVSHFQDVALTHEDALTAVLMVKPSGRVERPTRGGLPQYDSPLNPSLLERLLEARDWNGLSRAVMGCFASGDTRLSEQAFAVLLRASAICEGLLVNVALTHILGHGTKRDVKKGLSILEGIVRKDGVPNGIKEHALLILGDNAAGRHGTKRNISDAAARYLEAARYGCEGWVKVGALSEEEGDIQRAVLAYSNGASQGHPIAAYRLAIFILTGDVEGDASRVRQLLRTAAAGGVIEASELLLGNPSIDEIMALRSLC